MPAFACALACASCSSGDDAAPLAAAAPDTRPQVRFGTTADDSPWPSDAFLDASGHLAPPPLGLHGDGETLAALSATLAESDGASSHTSIFFATTGDAPEGPIDGHAYVVDIDAADAAPLALPLIYRPLTRELVAIAGPSVLFTQGHRYACLLDTPTFRRSPALDEALRGEGSAATLVAPVAAAAARASLALDAVAGASVFTVGRPTRVLHAIRAQLAALPAPVAQVDHVFVGAALDDFLGSPTTTRSGLGDPAGLVHEAIAAVVLGSFEAPGLATGDGVHLGRFEVDAAGVATVRGSLRIPFLLAVPRRATLASTPVLLFHHGLNASRVQVAAVANDYARAGYATLGLDAIWHGDRRPGAKDVEHNFTGAAGADGLADEDTLGALTKFFDFTGDAASGVVPLDGRVVRDNLRQGALDVCALVRLVREGDVSAIAQADPSLGALSFASGPLVYTGESFGSVIGALATAIEPGIAASVLAVGGAGIFQPLFADSPTFGVPTAGLLRAGFDADLDVSDPARLPGEAQRSLALMQAAVEPGDPLAYAPEIAANGQSLLLLMDYSDETIPNQSGELLARAAGATALDLPGRTHALRYVDLPSHASPLEPAAAGAPVVAVVQVDPATHIMFTRFADARHFAPGFPPTVLLTTPEPVDEPIEWLHAMTTAFADSVRAGAPRVADVP